METKETGTDLKSKLQECSSRENLEEVFESFAICDKEERLKILDNIMGNPETFYSTGIGPDLQYQREMSIFLTKTWKKINEFYERAGL